MKPIPAQRRHGRRDASAPELQSVLEELRRLEPIFHTSEFGTSVDDFARRMAPAYWEVGASGKIYSRGLILEKLNADPPLDAKTAGWTCGDFGLRRLGPNVFLLTYTLNQAGRVTRRATIWVNTEAVWQILYHQGTVVSPQS